MNTSYGFQQYSPSASASESHVLIYPKGYIPDGSKRLVVWCHSAGGLSWEGIASIGSWNVIETIVDGLQLPMISFDGQPPVSGLAQHWGNDISQSRLSDAIAFAGFRLNAKIDKVIMCGVSMGGMLSFNWARNNKTKIAALATFYPATSLQAIHDGTGGAGSGAASIESAYGGSLAGFNAAVGAHDPSQNSASIASIGAPMKMWYSDSDTTVGSANQIAFVNAVGGNLKTTVIHNAVHADMSQIPLYELSEFLKGGL